MADHVFVNGGVHPTLTVVPRKQVARAVHFFPLSRLLGTSLTRKRPGIY